MKKLWFYIVCWKHRNDTRFELLEQYVLILKAARRCGYDLRHAADKLCWDEKDKEDFEFFSARAEGWLDIFAPTGAKDYRHQLHMDIWNLESKVEKMKKVCDEAGVEYEDPDIIPF